jgi:hypothetical protein
MMAISSIKKYFQIISFIILLTFGAFSALDVFQSINNDEEIDDLSADYNNSINEQIIKDESELRNLPEEFESKMGEEPLKSDKSLLSKFGLPNENSGIDNAINLASSTIPQFGSTTYEFEYVGGKIASVQTRTIMMDVNGIYVAVANLTTNTGEVITQTVTGIGYDDYLYMGFGGAVISRFNYSGQYEISLAIYLPITGSPDYDLINSVTHVLGDWDASDFVAPIADTMTFNINPIDTDASGKFDQFYVEGQIPMLNYSGQLSIVSVIFGFNYFYSSSYNETVQSVSAFQTLNYNLTLFDSITYSMEEAENLFWAVAFGDFNGGVYEIYYSMFYLDPQEFDPPKLSFTMSHELLDTNSNSLYDIIQGTYNLTALESDIQYELEVRIEADSNNFGYEYFYGVAVLGSQILSTDFEMNSLSFSEFVGNVTITGYMHIDLPIVDSNNVTSYYHFHINKIATLFLDFTEFEPSPVDMNVIEFGGIDTDADGLYNEFLLDLEFVLDPDYEYIYVSVSLYDDSDPNYGSRYIGYRSTSRSIDPIWDGRLNLTITKNNFLLYGSNNSLIRARISVDLTPKVNTTAEYFYGRRNVEQNFSVAQFDPPPVEIISVTDYLRDIDSNGLAEELVLNVTLNITEPLTSPELSAYFTNGSNSQYIYIPGDVGVFSYELNFTYLRVIPDLNYGNGSFGYQIRIYDYVYGGTIRIQEGVTNNYSVDQFEELPVKFVPNSIRIDFYDNETGSEGKYGYDLITVSVDLNITTNDQHSLRVYLDVNTELGEYIYYESQYPYITNASIVTVTFEIEGWYLYKTKYDGNVTFAFRGRDYVDGSSFNFENVETTVVISYLDFDPPNVIVDLSRSVTTTTRDVDNNGLADFLDVTIPLKIYGDLDIRYSASLRDEFGNYLGEVYEYITVSVTNPQDLVLSYSSGLINERANAGTFEISIEIVQTDVWAQIEYMLLDIGIFDPADFDRWPAYFPDTLVVNSYEEDTQGDAVYDWVIFEIGIEVRIQDFYRVEATFRMETADGYSRYIYSYFIIDPSMSGTVNVKMRINGIEIYSFGADQIELYSIRLYDNTGRDFDSQYFNSQYVLQVDYNQFQSEIPEISTSVIIDDFAEYSLSYPNNPDIIETKRYHVSNLYENTIEYDEYRDGGTYPYTSYSFDPNTRYIWSNNYFLLQLDPNSLSLGTWFNAYENPAQIIALQSIEVMGLTIDVWVATDGRTYLYYDIITGLLVKEEVYGSYTKILVDSNFVPGEIREIPIPPVTTTIVTSPEPPTTSEPPIPSTTVTPITSTQAEKKSEKLRFDAPNLILILFGLVFVGLIRRKRN